MRTLGTLLLLSAAAFAQTSTTVQTPASPATVSVQPNKAQANKPSPNGAKASPASVKAAVTAKRMTPTEKAVSVEPALTAKSASVPASTKAVALSAKPRPTSTATKSPATVAKAVSVKAADLKPASAGPKAKVVPAQALSIKPATGPKVVGVLTKPAVVAATKGSQSKPVSVKSNASAKPAIAHVATKPVNVHVVAARPVTHVKVAAQAKVAAGKTAAPKDTPSVEEDKRAAENKPAQTEVHTGAGRRDPFLSPVVAMGATGSGCSAGKRCLSIDQIALKGVVKSESGMIAVVTNSLDKAYFLRENDPVFNGYVVKITGDSIIFKETFHDRLGKALTRDVTKSITRPVA